MVPAIDRALIVLLTPGGLAPSKINCLFAGVSHRSTFRGDPLQAGGFWPSHKLIIFSVISSPALLVGVTIRILTWRIKAQEITINARVKDFPVPGSPWIKTAYVSAKTVNLNA
jgi:hypothetical protein